MYYIINDKGDIIGESIDLFPLDPPLRLVAKADWQPDPEKALLARKAALLVEAAQKADAFVAQVSGLDAIPTFERESWAMQAREAQAHAQNPATPTPLLESIAKARGVPLDILREKALAMANAFTALTGSVAGQRQAYEDRIRAASDMAALDALTISYRLPMMPVSPAQKAGEA